MKCSSFLPEIIWYCLTMKAGSLLEIDRGKPSIWKTVLRQYYGRNCASSGRLPNIPVTAFSQTDLFLVWIYPDPHKSNLIPTGTSVTIAAMSTCRHQCRYVHVMPHCFILTESCSCRLELEYLIRGKKYLKIDWSVKMPLHYYGLLWELQAPSDGLLP